MPSGDSRRSLALGAALDDEKGIGDSDDRQHRGHAGGEETVIAEGVKDECLEIEKPQSDGEHDRNERGKKRPAFRVTESSKEREAERGKISQCAERRERNGTERRVFAAE